MFIIVIGIFFGVVDFIECFRIFCIDLRIVWLMEVLLDYVFLFYVIGRSSCLGVGRGEEIDYVSKVGS